MQDPAPQAPVPNPPPAAPWILVVDDQQSMRALLGIVLRAKGWLVQLADGAEEAFATVKAAARPPSLVICDVLMPRVDGLELVRRMCARYPGMNVIFISGHLTDVSWWPADLREHRFLAKPFDNEQLLAAVRDALADAGASI
jgi:DNA-binding NtrC family response regulator